MVYIYCILVRKNTRKKTIIITVRDEIGDYPRGFTKNYYSRKTREFKIGRIPSILYDYNSNEFVARSHSNSSKGLTPIRQYGFK
jgi:hypothetical protein